MEISSSTAIGIMKVGLQVVSSHKRPLLEFYYEVRNRFGPEQEFEIEKRNEGNARVYKTRFQDIFIQFFVVNVGGARAENIEFEVSGSLQRNKPRESLGELMKTEIPQMAPGQLIHLFKFDDDDLNIISEEDGSVIGIKKEDLKIVAMYDAPHSLFNSLLSVHRKMCGKKQYESTFVFKPAMVCGDLPPAEYV